MSLSENFQAIPNELLTLKAENEKLKKKIREYETKLEDVEFEKAVTPAILYMQRHGLATGTIIIEWDQATLQFAQRSCGVPLPATI